MEVTKSAVAAPSLFRKLPVEVRLKIWGLVVREYEFDVSSWAWKNGKEYDEYQQNRNATPSIITALRPNHDRLLYHEVLDHYFHVHTFQLSDRNRYGMRKARSVLRKIKNVEYYIGLDLLEQIMDYTKDTGNHYPAHPFPVTGATHVTVTFPYQTFAMVIDVQPEIITLIGNVHSVLLDYRASDNWVVDDDGVESLDFEDADSDLVNQMATALRRVGKLVNVTTSVNETWVWEAPGGAYVRVVNMTAMNRIRAGHLFSWMGNLRAGRF